MLIVGGLLVVLALVTLAYWLKQRGITVRWYEWLLGSLGLILLVFSLQNYFAATREFEPAAPVMFLLVFGLPALVLLVLAVGLPWLRINHKRKVTA
jgi:hypothetical protein